MPKVAKTQGKTKKKVAAKARPPLSEVGRGIGSLFGPLGSKIGSLAGSAIARVMGSGSYSVRGNTLTTNQAPAFMSAENGIRVCHREYISDVLSSQIFNNQKQWFINPGNPTLFPWLSQVANSFESYDLHGLVVTYKPTSGTALSSSSAAMGSVILSTEYDVLKPKFTSKRDAEAYQFTTMSVPYEGMMHPVECKPSLTVLPKKFVTRKSSPSELASDDDPRLHYHGLLQLMSTGQQTDLSALGELWVSYDVTLFTPRLAPAFTSMAMMIAEKPPSSDVLSTTNGSRFEEVVHSDVTEVVFTGDSHAGFQCAAATFSRTGYYLLVLDNVNDATHVSHQVSLVATGALSGGLVFQPMMTNIEESFSALRSYLQASQAVSINVEANRLAGCTYEFVYVHDPLTARYRFPVFTFLEVNGRHAVTFKSIYLGDDQITSGLAPPNSFANARVSDVIITEDGKLESDDSVQVTPEASTLARSGTPLCPSKPPTRIPHYFGGQPGRQL